MLCLASLSAIACKPGQPRLLDLGQPGAVLFDHPLVVLAGDGGQALRQQVVVGVAGLHFDDVALLAEVLDRLDQQQFDAAVRALREPLAVTGNAFLLGLRLRSWA